MPMNCALNSPRLSDIPPDERHAIVNLGEGLSNKFSGLIDKDDAKVVPMFSN